MINGIPTAPQTTNLMPPVLPDAADRASSLVGFNINEYVFGGAPLANQTNTDNLNLNQQTVKNKSVKNNKIAGFALLASLLAIGGFAYSAAKGKGVKGKNISEFFTNLFSKFKKSAPKA